MSKLGFEPGFETAASFCHMGLQLMFGYLVGNLRLENRFTQGWKIGLQTSYKNQEALLKLDYLVYIIRIIGNTPTGGK